MQNDKFKDDNFGVSNHQPHRCLRNRLFRRRSKKPSKLRVTGLCAGNSPVTGEFPAQMASNAKNVSIRWRHHDHSLEQWTISLLCIPWLTHFHLHTNWLYNFSIYVWLLHDVQEDLLSLLLKRPHELLSITNNQISFVFACYWPCFEIK